MPHMLSSYACVFTLHVLFFLLVVFSFFALYSPKLAFSTKWACAQKTKKIHNTIETKIYMIHPVWATSTREISKSFLYYYPANEGIQPTTHPL
jgi:hypothetical protein